MDDRVIGAGGGAFAALDALVLVDLALAVDEADRAPGADLLAGGRQAVLAVLCHPVLVGGAGVASVGDDVDQRGLIVLLGDRGLVHALGQQVAGLDGPQVQTHGQAHPLTGDGTLQEHGFPVQGLVAGDDDVGKLVGVVVALAGVGHPGHLGEDFFTDIGDQRRDASHGRIPPDVAFCISYHSSRG